VAAVSLTIDEHASNEDLISAVQRRAGILNGVSVQESVLRAESNGGKFRKAVCGATAALMQDIQDLVHSIAEQDAFITKIFKTRIALIREELTGLPAMAKAVTSYAGHSRY
jgi:hypothetical protein